MPAEVPAGLNFCTRRLPCVRSRPCRRCRESTATRVGWSLRTGRRCPFAGQVLAAVVRTRWSAPAEGAEEVAVELDSGRGGWSGRRPRRPRCGGRRPGYRRRRRELARGRHPMPPAGRWSCRSRVARCRRLGPRSSRRRTGSSRRVELVRPGGCPGSYVDVPGGLIHRDPLCGRELAGARARRSRSCRDPGARIPRIPSRFPESHRRPSPRRARSFRTARTPGCGCCRCRRRRGDHSTRLTAMPAGVEN